MKLASIAPIGQADYSTTPHQLDLFKRRFIPLHGSSTLRLKPFGYQALFDYSRKKWTFNRDAYLSDKALVSHLGGKYWLAGVGGSFTSFIAFDLDLGDDLDNRLSRLRSAFPEVELLLFSSPGGGYHCYLFLEKPTWLALAHSWAKERLAGVGLTLQSGKIELYPSGRLLRLPCGVNQSLLEPDTLLPYGNRKESLRALWYLLEHDKFDYLTIPSNWKPERPRKTTRNPLAAFRLEVEALYRDGLQGPGERNSALCKLNRFLTLSGMGETQRAVEMKSWLTSHHNGQSRDYNRNPQACLKQIERLAKTNYQPKKDHAVNLSTAIRQDERLAAHVAALNLGEKEGALLLEILTYALNRGLWIAAKTVKVEIPSRTMKTWNRTYRPVLERLIFAGLVREIGSYSKRANRCKTYAVEPPIGPFLSTFQLIAKQ